MNPPRYPPEENRRHIGGTVVLIITVDASGNATDVQVESSSGNRNLDREAVKAAKRWRFNPGMVGGRKTGGRVRVPVVFTPS
jgi:protein TonB